VVTVADYWRREPEWCLRRSLRLMLGLLLMATLEKQRLVKIRAFAAGFIDGVRHRMGPCERELPDYP
jgi:rhamnosyltransferase